jgi:hypothetical protein
MEAVWPTFSTLRAYSPGVMIRPLGWELTAVVVTSAACGALVLVGLDKPAAFLFVAVFAGLAPLVLLSAAVRLLVGIVEEDRRYRLAKARRRERRANV